MAGTGQVSFALIRVGRVKGKINSQELRDWQSSVFHIADVFDETDLGNSGSRSEYTDGDLYKLLSERKNYQSARASGKYDVILTVVHVPLRDQYYMRQVEDSSVVLTLSDTAEIVRKHGFKLEAFIIRTLYELAVVKRGSQKWPSNEQYIDFSHDDTNHCLFDFNNNIEDLVVSMDRPVLCKRCEKTFADAGPIFLSALETELKRLGKTRFQRGLDWVRSHPIRTMVASFIGGAASSLLATIIYEALKFMKK